MAEYKVHATSGADYIITGDNLKDACETNFQRLTRDLKLGNDAGAKLDKITFSYNADILSGKGGIVMSITAHGSDTMPGYDPTNDAPRTSEVYIHGTPDDLPENPEIELTEKSTYDRINPFSAGEDHNSWYTLGIICGIIDEIARNHSTRNPFEDDISYLVAKASPTLCAHNPLEFLARCQQKLKQVRVKNDGATTKLTTRMSELVITLAQKQGFGDEGEGSYQLGLFNTCYWFSLDGRVTALSVLRNKANKTQQQVADEVGISLRQYRRYEATAEAALCNANPATVAAVAKAVNATVSQIIDDDGHEILVDSKD